MTIPKLKQAAWLPSIVGAVMLSTIYSPIAAAAAIQTGSSLALSSGIGPDHDDSFEILVASNGNTTVAGIPGIADGTIYTGITHIIVDTGIFGDDTVLMNIAAPDINVNINTGIHGFDSVEIEMSTPIGVLSASPSFTINTGSNEANVVFLANSLASNFNMNLAIKGETQSKVEFNQLLGNATMNLSGRLGDLILGGGANFTVNGNVSSDSAKIEVNGNLSSNLVVQSRQLESIDLIVSGSLIGSPKLLGASSIKVEVGGNATGNVLLQGDVLESSLDYVVQGNLVGSPVVRGKAFSDSLKLQVGGFILSGMPVVDGGLGEADSCDVSPGVTIVSCM